MLLTNCSVALLSPNESLCQSRKSMAPWWGRLAMPQQSSLVLHRVNQYEPSTIPLSLAGMSISILAFMAWIISESSSYTMIHLSASNPSCNSLWWRSLRCCGGSFGSSSRKYESHRITDRICWRTEVSTTWSTASCAIVYPNNDSTELHGLHRR